MLLRRDIWASREACFQAKDSAAWVSNERSRDDLEGSIGQAHAIQIPWFKVDCSTGKDPQFRNSGTVLTARCVQTFCSLVRSFSSPCGQLCCRLAFPFRCRTPCTCIRQQPLHAHLLSKFNVMRTVTHSTFAAGGVSLDCLRPGRASSAGVYWDVWVEVRVLASFCMTVQYTTCCAERGIRKQKVTQWQKEAQTMLSLLRKVLLG